MQNVTATVVMARGGKNPSMALNFYEVRKIAAAIDELRIQGQVQAIVDWTDVDWINPMAIGLLIHRRAALLNAGGDLKFSRMNPSVRKIFSNFQVAEHFEIYDSLEHAIESFDKEWVADEQHRIM